MKTLSLIKTLLIATVLVLAGCSGVSGVAKDEPGLVLVAGATGGTGRALVRNLQAQGYPVRAFVRDIDKARLVLGENIEYAQGDVRDINSINAAMTDVDYVISSIGAGQKDPENGPEAVDYGGVKNMVEASAAADIKQFVLVSSSGVTQEDHFLNKIMNNVLKWKFKGEEVLRDSGVEYTIVRPGGLINEPGGQQGLIFAQGDTTTGRITREDVALICIEALQNKSALNKTFETYSTEEPGVNNWPALFSALQSD